MTRGRKSRHSLAEFWIREEEAWEDEGWGKVPELGVFESLQVKALRTSHERVEIYAKAFLREDHPLYDPVYWVRAKISFDEPKQATWSRLRLRAGRRRGRETTLGELESVASERRIYRLKGEFGKLKLVARRPRVELRALSEDRLGELLDYERMMSPEGWGEGLLRSTDDVSSLSVVDRGDSGVARLAGKSCSVHRIYSDAECVVFELQAQEPAGGEQRDGATPSEGIALCLLRPVGLRWNLDVAPRFGEPPDLGSIRLVSREGRGWLLRGDWGELKAEWANLELRRTGSLVVRIEKRADVRFWIRCTDFSGESGFEAFAATGLHSSEGERIVRIPAVPEGRYEAGIGTLRAKQGAGIPFEVVGGKAAAIDLRLA